MLKARLTVSNDLGLHARAAARLVKCVAEFESKVTITRPDLEVEADARSILSVLTLSASKGTELEVTVEGADEVKAMSAVEAIFADGFCNDVIQV